MSSRSFVFLNNSSFRSANHLTVIHLVNDHKRNVEFDFILYHFFRSGVMSLFTLSARKWGHPCTMDILFFSFGNCCDIWPAFEDRFNILLRVHYIVSLCPIHTFFDILRKYSGILCNPTSEFSDILWHPTKMYCPKVFLFTKIKPEYSDILYNPIHFPGALVYRIRQDPWYYLLWPIVFLDYRYCTARCFSMAWWNQSYWPVYTLGHQFSKVDNKQNWLWTITIW
jgi:hypothetical protein